MTGSHAAVVKVLADLCSCCLDEGRLTYLWLCAAGLYFFLFCPSCDGTLGE